MAIEVPTYKIAYMALPKAACTSVKRALAHVDPDVDLAAVEGFEPAHNKWHSVYPSQRFRPHRWEKYDTGWWRFCVVRDPLDRLLSGYVNRVVQFRELHNSPKLRRDRPDLPMDPDPDFFFTHLKEYIDHSSVVRHHALPTWVFLGPDLARYDRIYQVSDLDRFAADLSERTGKPVSMARENKGLTKLKLADLGPAARQALQTRLTPEYEYLARWYANPFE